MQNTKKSHKEEMDDYNRWSDNLKTNPHQKSDLGIVMAPLMLGMVLYLIAGDSNALSPETLTVIDSSGDAIAQTLQVTSDEVLQTLELLKESSKEEIMVLAEQVKEIPVQMQAALATGVAALTAGLYNAKDLWGEKLSNIFEKESEGIDDKSQNEIPISSIQSH